MKVLIVVDSFADGGEGTTEALVEVGGGKYFTHYVTHPLGKEKVAAKIGILPDKTAIVEMAAASGITLLKNEERNPFVATTKPTRTVIPLELFI